MTWERGGQRTPLGTLADNHGRGQVAGAVGSSTKDRGWQQRRGGSLPSRLLPASDKKKNKKVEGTVVETPQPAPASRIPAGPGAAPRSAAPPGSTASRIPRPPVFGAAHSPQPDLLGMLATPVAPGLLEELHASSSPGEQQQQAEQGGWAAPQGFHAYSNPSFNGDQFLAATPAADAGSSGSTPAVAVPAAAAAATAGARTVYHNGLAEAEAEAGAATPGLLDPAALTPGAERSLQAWLQASPTSGMRPQSDVRTHGMAAPATSGSSGRLLPTPEAWQVLQQVNDSPNAEVPQGVRDIMNAYLRTGPQALSPEPSATGELILAPGAAAVPATGLLNVAGPGGAGVYGMMNAYLRTGTHHLSPEPGMEAEARQGSLQGTAAPPMHPYSPVSPLAATPGAGGTAARSASRRPISPSSVCSNGGVGSSGPAGSISLGAAPLPSPASSGRPASVPRLNLAALQQDQPKRDGTDGTEVSFGAVVPLAAAAQQQQPDSPGGGELPTARFSPDASPAAGAGGEPAADPTPQRHVHRVPSPITFCLPDDSPKQQEAQPPATPSPTAFSFGVGAGPAGADQPAGPEAGAAEQAAEDQQLPAAAAAAEAHDSLPRIGSGESVLQPNPFTAMLLHLRGPQYASPARFALRGAQLTDSPQSPKECTPLHLISASDHPDARSPVAGRTPAPGQGSLTVWMDRRGMRDALSTPARNDLRLLWAAAHELSAFKSEAAALRADNAALAAELEATQAALAELGVEHGAAVVAAEAGALCAEAELARARDAAGHMMSLADQIQGMFELCEDEKEELVGQLQAARQKLVASETAAAGAASGQQRQELQAQLDEARQAVAAAQAAADDAQQRATAAAAELESIRSQLAAAQAQMAAQQAGEAAAEAEAAPTPLAKLRHQLDGLHESLAQLHAEHCAGRLHASTPALDRLLEASRGELVQVERLLGGDAAALRAEHERLRSCLAQARGLLAENSPAGSDAAAAWTAPRFGDQGRSPLPFALFGQHGSESEPDYSPATTATLCGACASPDVFASPFLASQTTLTVDYRTMQQTSSVRQGSPTSPSTAASPSLAEASSASPMGSVAEGQRQCEGASPGGMEWEGQQQGSQEGQQGEEEYTVVHNGMVITHVPASEVSKVRSMVQYWEAVASGTPLPHVSEEEAAAAEAYANAAIAAAEAAMAAHEQQADAETAPAASTQAEEGEAAAAEPAAATTPIHVLPVATPIRFTGSLPAGDAATPGALPAATATPARLTTPLNFAAAPPPTPTDGVDPAQAQQLHHLALSFAAAAVGGTASPAATPASAQATSSRVPSTPMGTPAGGTALAVTPLALSALRARLGGSVGGVQDAVRSRLARLKADLAAAQAKLATVDQGLASIALTPASTMHSSTPGSRSSSLLRRTPATPSTGGTTSSPLGAPSASGSPASTHDLALSGSRAAALIAAGGMSRLGLAGTSPAAVSQPQFDWQTPAQTLSAEAQGCAPRLAAAEAPTVVAPAAEVTPVTRRSVRWADTVQAGSPGQGRLRVGTPYSAAAACDLAEEGEGSAISPVVASCRRSPLGMPPNSSPAAAAWQRSPLAAMQSTAKPAAVPMRRFAAGDASGSSSEDDDSSELLFDASRMAQRAARAAQPLPSRLLPSSATPMAHPERELWDDGETEGHGSYEGGARSMASALTSGTSILSASSFSPPRPLVLLRPLARARRGMLRSTTGRPRSEAEEREFRRRAAALNIQISPYFRRPGSGSGSS